MPFLLCARTLLGKLPPSLSAALTTCKPEDISPPLRNPFELRAVRLSVELQNRRKAVEIRWVFATHTLQRVNLRYHAKIWSRFSLRNTRVHQLRYVLGICGKFVKLDPRSQHSEGPIFVQAHPSSASRSNPTSVTLFFPLAVSV